MGNCPCRGLLHSLLLALGELFGRVPALLPTYIYLCALAHPKDPFFQTTIWTLYCLRAADHVTQRTPFSPLLAF